MYFSKSIPLCFLLLSLLLQAAIGADPLFHFCFIPENYTANDPFSSNLNELTTLLSSKVPPTGFGLASTGQGQGSVNGLALCRGDVSSRDCKSCVTEATKELHNRCPYNKGAIIWYDTCLFKYSNVKFFGEIDNKNKFYMYNVQSVDDPTSFNVKIKELLSSLSNKAYGSPVLFVTGELVLEESMKLYGLAQCTRDLSSLDCKKCLDDAVSELPSCCDGKRGGRVVGGSCNVSSQKFIDNGTYETNLNKLMGYLYLAAPPTGFGKGSVGENNDQVNGLALCRGDVSNTDCKACITESSSEIRKLCPDNKAAIIWYDYCLLKYSNVNFFGQVDYQNMFYMWNLNNVSDPASFNQKTKELLSNLAQKAFINSKMYATGELELEESKKLYGLTQCTRDLSSSDCKKCLDDAISKLPNCCDGKEGGRVVGGSCNIRYEIYPFVNS